MTYTRALPLLSAMSGVNWTVTLRQPDVVSIGA
jgi:hypothetical protein